MSEPSSPQYDEEKNGAATAAHAVPGDRYAEGLGDIQVLKRTDSEDLKLAKDGTTVLIPQPSDDPEGTTPASVAKGAMLTDR
jgi:hypothetical protein